MDLLKKTDCKVNYSEIRNKKLSISCVAATAALCAVENKIPMLVIYLRKQIMTQKFRY